MKTAFVVAFFVLSMLVTESLLADSATIWEWESPTEREDGTEYDSATETDRYELACGRNSPDEVQIGTALGGTNELEVDMADKLDSFGRYDCVIRVVDYGGLVSEWSESVRYVHNAAPTAPGRLRF